MKNSITLSQIARQKSLSYKKVPNKQEKNINKQQSYRQASSNSLLNNLKQKQTNQNKQMNTLFHKYIKMKQNQKHLQNKEFNFKQHDKLISNKISAIDFSAKRHKQTITPQSNIKFSNFKAKSSNNDNQFGFSTLMDLQLSQIRQSLKSKKDSSIKSNNISSSSLSIQQQISKMREKFQQIQKNPLQIPDYHPYSPYDQPSSIGNSQEDPWLLYLKSQIIQDKAKKLINTIIKIFLRRLYKQLDIYDSFKLISNKRIRKVKREILQNWKQYIQQQGQKRNMMKMIKQRVISRRKDKLLQQQLKQIMNQNNSNQKNKDLN